MTTTTRPGESGERERSQNQAEGNALHMIRADINQREMYRWMDIRGIRDQDQALHCLLNETMGKWAPKPFRLMTRHDSDTSTVYGYTRATLDEVREALTRYGDPLQTQVISPLGINAKEMPDDWTPGESLGFEARVRPTVRTPEKKEIDRFARMARQAHEEGKPIPTRDEVYAQWVAEQVARDGAATADPGGINLVSYQWIHGVRQATKGRISGPDAVLRGALVIQDSDAFNRLLARGLGRHRAYGYGMLLLKPQTRQ